MKLATALSERADLQKRIAELGVRLKNNAKVQEGDTPSENPTELLKELDACFTRLEWLIARINITNNETMIGDQRLVDLLAKMDCLKLRISTMRAFLDTSSEKVNRYSKTEIKIMSTVSVAELQKQVDDYAKQLREADEQIQSLNWTVDLL